MRINSSGAETIMKIIWRWERSNPPSTLVVLVLVRWKNRQNVDLKVNITRIAELRPICRSIALSERLKLRIFQNNARFTHLYGLETTLKVSSISLSISASVTLLELDGHTSYRTRQFGKVLIAEKSISQ